MKTEEILKKAIEKAVENGYKTSWKRRYENDYFFKKMQYKGNYEAVIFSHDFAKEFWNKKLKKIAGYTVGGLNTWQYHLSVIVLEEDPIQYLEKFL